MDGAAKNGVAVSIKHFPGDGCDERDQHLVASVNDLSCEEWDATYGKIYKSLIEKGAQTVMAGHIPVSYTHLEMIKEIKKQQIQCRFVLISGYRDFEFAQAAVKLGVSDYILKPINEDEVNAVLKSLAEEESEGGEEEFRKKAIRQKFREVLAGDTAVPDLETVEKKYCFHFQKEDAFFRVLQLGFCGCREGEEVEQVAGDIWNILRKNISECCVEQEMFPSSWLRYNIVLQIKDDMKSRIQMCIRDRHMAGV